MSNDVVISIASSHARLNCSRVQRERNNGTINDFDATSLICDKLSNCMPVLETYLARVMGCTMVISLPTRSQHSIVRRGLYRVCIDLERNRKSNSSQAMVSLQIKDCEDQKVTYVIIAPAPLHNDTLKLLSPSKSVRKARMES